MISEDFFSEREVSIGDGGPAGARQAYRLLMKSFSSAPTYQHDTYGYPKKAKGSTKRRRVAVFFRGNANHTYGLESSLHRSVKDDLPENARSGTLERHFQEAEERVLDLAQANGVVRNMTNLQRLAVLQHHQAPTRLIDVTSDWRVALYFAVEKHDSIDGRLFCFTIDTARAREVKDLSQKGRLFWWGKRPNGWQTGVWPVLLPFSDSRMVAQSGYFFTGGLVTTQGQINQYRPGVESGDRYRALTRNELRQVSTLAIRFPMYRGLPTLESALDDLLNEDLTKTWKCHGISLRIPASWKASFREYLAEDGISQDSIYPPIGEVERLLKYIVGSQLAAD